MDKYLTLRSTDCKTYFPENKSNDFKVHLNNPLHLKEGQWLVGLSEITILNWSSKKTADIFDVYIYSSLCENSPVSDSELPLLRHIVLQGNKKERRFVFPTCHYIPVKVRDIQDIHLYIKDRKGEPASFITGPVIVTLHLKPLPFWF